MTQDEIIRMAQEAGFALLCSEKVRTRIERFANLVAAHEREKQAEQEPVAWIKLNENGVYIEDVTGFPVYAAPVRTKDLTDEEIQKWIDVLMYDPPEWALRRFARAVIAADREKNK